LVRVRILVIKLPAVFSIGLTGIKALFITVVNSIAKHLCTILAGVVILPAPIVTVIVYEVIVILCLLQSQLVLS